MSYGSTSYGSTSLGGLPASRFVFFSPTELVVAGTYQRSVEYPGSAEFFEILAIMQGTTQEPERIMRVYTHNDPDESPQLARTVGLEAFYSQTIITAARFIVVEAELPTDTLSIPTILITGNEYFQ